MPKWVCSASLIFFLAFSHFLICYTMNKNYSYNDKNKPLLSSCQRTYTPPGRHIFTVQTDWVISVGWAFQRQGISEATGAEQPEGSQLLSILFITELLEKSPQEPWSNSSLLLILNVWFSLA